MKPDDMFIRVICYLVGFLIGFLIGMTPVRAHHAPSGWAYPTSCCSGMDCHEIPKEAVKITPAGYLVTVTPADHMMLIEPTTFTVPYTAPNIRPSPDGVYHLCISRQYRDETGALAGGKLICFFQPPNGA